MKVLAAFSINGTPVPVPSGIPVNMSVGKLAGGFIQAAIALGIIVSLFYLIYGGFFWIQSKGNKETLDKARRIIVYAIIGLIVMSLSLVVVSVIMQAVGVDPLTK